MSDRVISQSLFQSLSLSMRQGSLLLSFVLLCSLLATTMAMAQSVTGSISGTIMDSSGAFVPGAAVTLTDQRTADSRKLASNPEGRFVFSALQPGTYSLRVEKEHFQSLEQKDIVVSANEDVALARLELKTGQVTETVTVSAGSNRVDTESSDLTTRLTADQISLIPVKGRDITSLLRVLPGTSFDADIEAVGEGFGTNLPNFSGQRGRSAVATVDGLNGAEPSGNNKLSMTINQEAIAEVKVLRNNYSAEYGNNGGAMVNLITKSGSQNYHGSGYYFLRNEALNANNYLSNNAGIARALYRHNIWGVSLGGPVQVPKIFPNREKNKLFFFYSYEKPHTITPQDPRLVTVPTALERAGDFSQSLDSTGKPVSIIDPVSGKQFPGNVIPKQRWNSSGLAILNFFPLPNAAGPFNYITQKSVDVPKRSQVARFDIKVRDNDSINIHTQQWTSDNEGFQTSGWPGGTPPDANTWGIGSHYLYKDDGMTVGWTHIFNQRMVNEVTVGARHDTEGFIPSTGVIDRLSRTALNYTAPQIFPTNNLLGTIPRATGWSSVNGRPANINWLDRWGEVGSDHIYPSVGDNLSISRGDHIFKAGVYFENLINTEAPGGNWSGTFNFGTSSSFTASLGNTGYAYANALLGNFNSYTEDAKRPFTNLQIMLLQWYAQDEWKVSRRLTLNYGLRFGYHTQLYQRDQLASNFDPTLFNPAQAQVLYQPFCVGGTPALGTACATSNRRALNPVTGGLDSNTNLVGTFVPGVGNALNGIALQSDPKTPAGFKNVQPVDFEPRFGFAFDVTGTGKTVLRAMGGVYHSPRAGGGTTGGNLVSNSPFQRTLTVNNGNIDNLVNLVPFALSSPTTLNGVEVDSATPTIYNYSLGVQQDLGYKTIMEVTYVGSLARHLGVKYNLNSVPDGAKFLDIHPENRDPFSASSAKADNFLRPFQGIGSINITRYNASSNYNGLQVQLNRRYANSLQYGIAYTYSKTLDYGKDDDSSDVSYPRPYKKFNYAPADFDQTHIFTANYIWDVPIGRLGQNSFTKAILGNWQASGLTSFVSGKPKSVTVTYAGTASATNITDFTGGTVNAFPNVICNPNQGVTGVSSTGIPIVINTSCFAKPTVRGDIGNAGRNLLRLPGLITTDVAVMKNIHTTEKTALQFRWEVYNLFNHTNFSDIDASMTFDPTGKQTNTKFGVPTAARPPRIMQGSLRFSF